MHKFNNPPLIGLSAWNDVAHVSQFVNRVFTPSISTLHIFKYFKTSLFDRIENYFFYLIDYAVDHYIYNPTMDAAVLKSLPNTPPLSELKQQMKIVLFNHDPIFDAPDQFPPNVIGVGGLQIKSVQPLPKVYLNVFPFHS